MLPVPWAISFQTWIVKKNILNTSVVTSNISGSTLIFASCVHDAPGRSFVLRIIISSLISALVTAQTNSQPFLALPAYKYYFAIP